MGVLNSRIKERRLDLGLTLLEIAEFLEVKEATVQRYESGEIKNIKHDTVVGLAKILKTTPSYLMGWEEAQEEKPTVLAAHYEGENILEGIEPEQLKDILEFIKFKKSQKLK